MKCKSHRSWRCFRSLRALTGLSHPNWPHPGPPPTATAPRAPFSSAFMPGLSYAAGGLAPSPGPRSLLGSPGLTSVLRRSLPCWVDAEVQRENPDFLTGGAAPTAFWLLVPSHPAPLLSLTWYGAAHAELTSLCWFGFWSTLCMAMTPERLPASVQGSNFSSPF